MFTNQVLLVLFLFTGFIIGDMLPNKSESVIYGILGLSLVAHYILTVAYTVFFLAFNRLVVAKQNRIHPESPWPEINPWFGVIGIIYTIGNGLMVTSFLLEVQGSINLPTALFALVSIFFFNILLMDQEANYYRNHARSVR